VKAAEIFFTRLFPFQGRRVGKDNPIKKRLEVGGFGLAPRKGV